MRELRYPQCSKPATDHAGKPSLEMPQTGHARLFGQPGDFGQHPAMS